MRPGDALLAAAAALLLAVAVHPAALGASAQSGYDGVVTAFAYVAPYGFILELDRPLGQVRFLVAEDGSLIEYPADASDGRIYVPTIPDGLVSEKGRFKLDARIVTPAPEEPLVLLVGEERLVVGLGAPPLMYKASARLFWGPPEPGDPEKVVYYAIAGERPRGAVDPSAEATQYLAVESIDGVVRVRVAGVVQEIPVTDFLGVDDACVMRLPGDPWVAGILAIPTCVQGLEIAETIEWEGRLLHTVVEVGSVRVYLAGFRYTFSSTAPISRMVFDSAEHVSPVNVAGRVYVPPLLGPEEGREMYASYEFAAAEALDSTVVYEGRRYCSIPSGAEIVFAALWDWSPERGGAAPGTIFELLPWETVVYQYGGSLNVCYSPPASSGTVTVETPEIAQLRAPVVVRGSGFVVVLSGGQVFEVDGALSIPHSLYSRNKVLVAAYPPFYVDFEARNIWETPALWFALLLVMAVAGVLLYKPRPPVSYIRFKWDIFEPPPPPVYPPDSRRARDAAGRFVDRFGVCPDDVELAMNGLLVEWRGEPPDKRVIVCPGRGYSRSGEAELALRRLAETLRRGFWHLVRQSASTGYAATPIGGEVLLVAPVYRQAGEREPPELLYKAILAASRLRVVGPAKVAHAPVIIVAETEMARRLREELEDFVVGARSQAEAIENYLTLALKDRDAEGVKRAVKTALERHGEVIIYDGSTEADRLIIEKLGARAQEEEARLRRA